MNGCMFTGDGSTAATPAAVRSSSHSSVDRVRKGGAEHVGQ